MTDDSKVRFTRHGVRFTRHGVRVVEVSFVSGATSSPRHHLAWIVEVGAVAAAITDMYDPQRPGAVDALRAALRRRFDGLYATPAAAAATREKLGRMAAGTNTTPGQTFSDLWEKSRNATREEAEFLCEGVSP